MTKSDHLPGNVEIRDWRYWLPYLAAYSGARLGELSQMLTGDVRQHHGVWVLHVTPEGSQDESVKTDGSARVVPLHSRLIELGFLDYHVRMVEREKQLFPELKPDTRGHYSRMPSRFFAGYFKNIGVKEDKSRNFHSCRHSAADAFRRDGYMDETFGPLLDPTKATTTGIYGVLPQGVSSERQKIIEASTTRQFPREQPQGMARAFALQQNMHCAGMYSWHVEIKKEIDMPTETIIVAGFVACVITIFSLAIAYGQRQTTAYRREHPQR